MRDQIFQKSNLLGRVRVAWSTSHVLVPGIFAELSDAVSHALEPCDTVNLHHSRDLVGFADYCRGSEDPYRILDKVNRPIGRRTAGTRLWPGKYRRRNQVLPLPSSPFDPGVAPPATFTCPPQTQQDRDSSAAA